MFRHLRGVTTQEKKAVNYYSRGYTDGIAGAIMPLDYTTATKEDVREYARGYADGRNLTAQARQSEMPSLDDKALEEE